MNPTPLPPLKIYGDYCHHASPTIKGPVWIPMRGIDFGKLKTHGMYDDGKELFYYSNHPIKWVRITGVVVGIEDFGQRRLFTVDDSSEGLIECVAHLPPPTILLPDAQIKSNKQTKFRRPIAKESPKPTAKALPTYSTLNPLLDPSVDLGTVIKVKGKPVRWREAIQLDIVKAEVIRGTEEELRCWREVREWRVVLSEPWVVSEQDEIRYRRRAERRKSKGRKMGELRRYVGEKEGKKAEGMRRESVPIRAFRARA